MTSTEHPEQTSRSNAGIKLTLAWLAVGVPLLWGVVQTLHKAMALFH
ncbi:MAG TPA: hypothetical protein VN903_37595 [Polyangia bacterium]|jgi:hypothetical protein|nr:hypothetical protein [Polyangia bacterium]